MSLRMAPFAALALVSSLYAQSVLAPPPTTVEGVVATVEVKATAPDLKSPAHGTPEAQALIDQLRKSAEVKSTIYLVQDLSRQEILSTGFALPQGTVILHKAGDKFYVIADPSAKAYVIMDSETLLTALEGGAGIQNTQYAAKVTHTNEKRDICGLSCRKSTITVTYATSIPFENDRVFVQEKNDIVVWHTAAFASAAAMDHFFFRFQRDRTGEVQKELVREIGFPMDLSFDVTQGGTAKRPPSSLGSLHMLVTDLKQEKKLESSLFQIPPQGYRKLDRNPYFKAAPPSPEAHPSTPPTKLSER
jgi:hypothetical protein